ncbi:hypothetical protein V8D89_009800 [Ganoderma adspersum]
MVILLMYASTVLHWTTLLLNVIGYYNLAQAYAAQLFCQCTNGDTCIAICPVIVSPKLSCTMDSFGISGAMHGLTVCVPTGILTINVMLGNAVVWWRVWVVWPRSLLVRGTCFVLLSATLEMGMIDTVDSCSGAAFSTLSVFNLGDVYSGSFYELNPFGLTASVLSLATNAVATALIGCKALKQATSMGSVLALKRSSRVEKILIFLVESGAIYCVIWVFILIHQAALLGEPKVISAPEEKVFNTFDYFMKGCLIPLIGMYPTVIIILVTLNKSHFITTTSARSIPSRPVHPGPTLLETSGDSSPGLDHWISAFGNALESMK